MNFEKVYGMLNINELSERKDFYWNHNQNFLNKLNLLLSTLELKFRFNATKCKCFINKLNFKRIAWFLLF